MRYLSIVFLLVYSISIYSQNPSYGSLTARVVDERGKGIESVLVAIKGMTIAQNTDEDGTFTFSKIPVGKHTLILSSIEIQEKTIAITIDKDQTTTLGDIVVNASIELDEVVVTGKTEARRVQELAYAVSVLDSKKLYNTTSTIGKVLNNVSSVRMREDGGVGSDYSFSLNGFSGKQVKFFLDGIPMDNFGASFNLANLSLNMTDRVEVYKGVLPVHLGADALGGAINIITRKTANYIDASYSYGSFNTNKVALNTAFTDVKSGFTFRLNGFFNYSDNDYKVYAPIVDLETSKIVEYKNVKRFNDNYRSGGVRVETGVTNKSYADYLLLGLIWSKNDADVQTGATMDVVYGGVKAKSESLIPSIRWKKDDLFVEGLSASFYGSYGMVNSFKIDTLSRKYNWLGEWKPTSTHGEGFNTDSKIKNRDWVANANVSYMLNMNQSLTINHVLNATERKIHDKVDPDNESNKIPQKLDKNITGLGWLIKYDRWNVNIFAKMYNLSSKSTKIFDRFTDDERIENLKVNKTEFGYGSAFSYFLLPKLQAKVSYEHAYRLPDSNEMFGDGLIQQANPDLKPEKSDNVNIGFIFEQTIKDHTFNAEVNGIYRYTTDFIRKAVSLTSNPTTGYENVGKVRTTGFEGSLNYRWRNRISLGSNITYQNIRDRQKYETVDNSYVNGGSKIKHLTFGERIPNIPYLFGSGNTGLHLQDVAVKNSELSLDYSLNWVKGYYLSFTGLGARSSKKVIPSQTSHDISLAYSLEDGKYNLAFECLNFTNKRLYDNYRLQKPGRSFNVKFRYFINW